MIQYFKDFAFAVKMTTGAGRKQLENEIEKQRVIASQTDPSIEEKRKRAIEYLGDRWILAKKQERLPAPRSF